DSRSCDHCYSLLLHTHSSSSLHYTTLFRSHKALTTQVNEVVREYNNTLHSVTGYTPLFLMTGIDNEDLFDGEDVKKILVINSGQDRKSTRLNSSHVSMSYADFCLKKK